MFDKLRELNYMRALAPKYRPMVNLEQHAKIDRIRVFVAQLTDLIFDGFNTLKAKLTARISPYHDLLEESSRINGNPLKFFIPGQKLDPGDANAGLAAIKKNDKRFGYTDVPHTDMQDEWENPIKTINKMFAEKKFISIPLLIHQDGGHIVSIFVDKDAKQIEYYDLRLSDPKTEKIYQSETTVQDFMEQLKRELFHDDATILVNQNKLQTDFFNCGVHVLDVAIKRLNGLSFNDFQHMKDIGQINKIREALGCFIIDEPLPENNDQPQQPVKKAKFTGENLSSSSVDDF